VTAAGYYITDIPRSFLLSFCRTAIVSFRLQLFKLYAVGRPYFVGMMWIICGEVCQNNSLPRKAKVTRYTANFHIGKPYILPTKCFSYDFHNKMHFFHSRELAHCTIKRRIRVFTLQYEMKTKFTNLIKSFILPTTAKLNCFKISKFTLKFTINSPTCFGSTKPSSESLQSVLR
jgi:hypothetical protein